MIDESGRLHLIDFGMARWRHAWSGRRAGPSGGTLAFMAPGAGARRKPSGWKSPTTSSVSRACVAPPDRSQSPFGVGTRQEQGGGVPASAASTTRRRVCCGPAESRHRLERICLKAMAAEPEDRYASAVAMAEALDDSARRPLRLALEAAAMYITGSTDSDSLVVVAGSRFRGRGGTKFAAMLIPFTADLADPGRAARSHLAAGRSCVGPDRL